VAGAILQRELLHHFRLDCLTVSARGLRYGLLYSLQKENP
jgi:exopolyphosphatase/pppGpp-phosphohydrolase